MAVTCNPRYFTIKGTLQKNQIHITRHLLLSTFEINWSSVLLKLGNTEATIPTLVTVYLMDKCRDRCIMDGNEHIPYITLLTGFT